MEISKEVVFGSNDKDSSNIKYYNKLFDIEKFLKLVKISTLSENLNIMIKDNDSPLLIKTLVGTLGTFNVFINPKSD